MENLRPWCISRQLWWGHRLPVYYCDACEETYVSATALERCGSCSGAVRQDEDVLDTWFSSSLWPFATLGWPAQTAELAAFYPTDVLVTARDIISLWVARMLMMGIEFCGEVPFSDVYITSVIQAADGRRMSKSLGTGVDPLVEIERHGADAVRFGMLAMSSTQDVRYSIDKVEQGQGLANKLFNATRFALLRIDTAAPAQALPGAIEDRWILSRLTQADRELAERLAGYDFAHAALGLYDFVYGELCDWYIELVKSRLTIASERGALSSTIRFVLRETLQIAHPVIPFVTEEAWSYVRAEDEGLLAGQRREPLGDQYIDPGAEEALGRVIAATQALRGWRDGVGVAPGARVSARIDAPGYGEIAHLIAAQARLELRDSDANGSEPLASVAIPGGAIAVFDGVDREAEAARAARRSAELAAEIERARGKLANGEFVANAPAAVVERERDKLAALERELGAL
jgi:valyl-tRNA synthetase